MKKIKSFDCIDMKRSAQEEIYKEIKNMSIEEELAYWRSVHEKHAREFKKINEKSSRNR